MPRVSNEEALKLQKFLNGKFNHKGIAVRTRAQAPDSVEVLLDGEFIGVIYKDEDEGETGFTFNMAILDIDLDEEAAA